MSRFRKIPATDSKYKSIEEKYDVDLREFQDYSSSKSQSDGSGKANSYRRYLIRYIVHLQEVLNVEIDDLLSIETLNQIKKLTTIDGFNNLNLDHNHFYSATLAEFEKYIKILEKNK